MTTTTIPFIQIYEGAGDNLRLARETNCMYGVGPTYAWCPQGLPKALYPFPRINLIDRPNHHEAIVHTWSVNGESAHEIARDLVARIVDEIPVIEFLVILLGENHLAFSSSYSGSDEDLVDSPDDLKARHMARMFATGPVL